MQVITKKDRKTHQNSDVCTAYEYPFSTSSLNAAVIDLNGRYPDSGYCINHKSDEIGYIIKGSGTITVEEETRELSQGDMVFIPKGKKFFWDGNMDMIVPCVPAWTPEQYEYMD